MTFRVAQIDNVEVFVPDRRAAAAWYAEVLGLAPLPGAEKADFLTFLVRAEQLGLKDGELPVQVVDHETAFSAYFADPYGHRLEVTTYDHEDVRAARRPATGGPPSG
jgi:hypothetical protein